MCARVYDTRWYYRTYRSTAERTNETQTIKINIENVDEIQPGDERMSSYPRFQQSKKK